ncbi:MAG: TerC/Alx family metal homeostasis membrane protein [Rickettsiales bacterium]|jgi:tellurite resistance protein TerC|nr:TerC/Alx family metal homeostasis membrane protein [Rickettsiales bacterium]
MEYSLASIGIFAAIVAGCLLLDLFAHRRDAAVSVRSAALWSAFWIIVSLGFAMYIRAGHGPDDAFAFLSGYVLEKTLSIDNLFVLMAIFANFQIPEKYQHRVLYYGIIGALVLRIAFVALGGAVVSHFGGTALAVFGLFIIWSAVKMAQAAGIGLLAWSMFRRGRARKKQPEKKEDFKNHWSVRLFGKMFRTTPRLDGNRFFSAGAATPLFLCLLTIEFADIMFAFDSVPAVIAITGKPFLVYTSNIFAILGMRSLYFCLAAMKRSLVHLDKAVIAILLYIGAKMLGEVFFGMHASAGSSLIVVLGLMLAGVAASFIWPGGKVRRGKKRGGA